MDGSANREESKELFLPCSGRGNLLVFQASTSRTQDRHVVGIGMCVDSSNDRRVVGVSGALCSSVCHYGLVPSLTKERCVGQVRADKTLISLNRLA